MKLLDCTIRDGGYYNNWDFNKDLITEYSVLMESLPIDYIEVGYRSIALEGYLGKYYYCPVYVLKELKSLMPSKKLVIILNEKDIRVEDLEELLMPIKPFITMVRMAVDPKNFERAIILAKAVKAIGFEVAFNVMYMSDWKNDSSFLNLLDELDETLDFFYMVDSFGGILPDDVKQIIKLVQSKTEIPLGFHGHDNLSLGLINSITAMEQGCEIIDSTITGMGRGAGNLRTELLLTYLESQSKIKINFNELGKIVSKFEELKIDYGWGTNLPYMFSGANSLPQKDVMKLIALNRYSAGTIIKKLSSEIDKNNDITLNQYSPNKNLKNVLFVGGGKSVETHKPAINEFISSNKIDSIIFSSSKYINTISTDNINCKVVMLGKEASKIFSNRRKNYDYIFPSSPREMGTYLGQLNKEKCFELKNNEIKDFDVSPLSMCHSIAKLHDTKKIFLVGFDGYDNSNSVLFNETTKTIEGIIDNNKIEFISLTPTNYEKLKVKSIYSFI